MSTTGALKVKQESGPNEDSQHKFEPLASLANSKNTQFTCLTFLADSSLIVTGTQIHSAAMQSE
jgi:hypothetical protein